MPLEPNFQPKTLRECIDEIVSTLDENEIKIIQSTNYIEHHFWYGRSLRNNLGLWNKETPLVQWCIKNLGLGHADDISGLILQAIWARVNEEFFDQAACVEKYKQHWAKLGVDSVTGKKYEDSDRQKRL